MLDRPHRLDARASHTWAAPAEVGRSLPRDVRLAVRGEARAFSAGLDRAAFPAGVAVAAEPAAPAGSL